MFSVRDVGVTPFPPEILHYCQVLRAEANYFYGRNILQA